MSLGADAPASVVDAFIESVRRNPHRVAGRVVERSRQEYALTAGELNRMMGAAALGMAARGIHCGDRVVLALPASRDFLALYLGALYAGIIPLVTAEPKAGRLARYADHLRGLATAAGATAVVVAGEDEAAGLAPLIGRPVLTAAGIRSGARAAGTPARGVNEGGVAHLQATSGSTGTAKLAMVRHANVVANVAAIGRAVGHRPDDVLVTWLPLSHDMGLIGLSYALYHGIPVVLSDTANFVANPLSWLDLLARHRGTLSPAPNSAFQMCARLARLRPPRGLDLSSWRVALCGAEPVHESTLRQFGEAFADSGLAEGTLLPVYGLAEATLAVTLPETGRPFAVDRVDADLVASGGAAEPLDGDHPRALPLVCVGRPVEGHALRVVAADGTPLPDRRVGEIEFKGPSVVDGYWNDPEATAALKRPDGWLRTGDLGYTVDGGLYVTGRHKDLLIVNGRNYTPNQIETLVETVTRSAVTPAAIAVGVHDAHSRTEALHLLLDTRLAAEDGERAVEVRVREALEEVFAIGGVNIHWVASGRIPRTPSGKVQRHLCRNLVEDAIASGRRNEKDGASVPHHAQGGRREP